MRNAVHAMRCATIVVQRVGVSVSTVLSGVPNDKLQPDGLTSEYRNITLSTTHPDDLSDVDTYIAFRPSPDVWVVDS